MTVKDVWGRVDGLDAGVITGDGTEWYFSIPEGVEGDFPAEFWAEDEAGNVGHAAAMLSIERGGVKCIRMIRTDGECVMKSIRRPACEMREAHASCTMHPIVCPCVEG